METRKKEEKPKNQEADNARKLLAKSANVLSDLESSSSSDGSGNDDYDEDNDFVVGGSYANDYVKTPKNAAKPNKKKLPEQTNTLLNLLQKAPATKPKAKTNAKPSAAQNKSTDIESILQELDNEDDPRKKSKRKKKEQIKARPTPIKPSFSHNKKASEEETFENDINDDDDLPPPPDSPPPKQTTSRDIQSSIPEEKIEMSKPTTQTPDKKKKIRSQPIEEYNIQKIDINSLDLGDSQIEVINNIEIDEPEDGTLNLFLFHVHEEAGKLFLFCKYLFKDNYQTVCIQIGLVNYYLQFLPIPGHEEALIDEVQKVCSGAKCGISKQKYCKRQYAFDKLNVPALADWYCVQVTSKCEMDKIPPEGDHYSHVFGITASLTENFLLKRKISGPSWIKVTEAKKFPKQISTCPMFQIKTIKSVHSLPENQQPSHIPPFNLCTFALRTVTNDKNVQTIVMLSMKILYSWNVEQYKPTRSQSTKLMTFVCPTKDVSLSTRFVQEMKSRQDVVVCENETELLTNFVVELEKMDIDLISSFGLSTSDIQLIYEKLNQHRVKLWYYLGRIHHTPLKGKFDLMMAIAGRVPVDLRTACTSFLFNLKVNDFSAIVKECLNKDRQMIDHFDLIRTLPNYDDDKELLSYNIRDASFVSDLLSHIQVLPLTLQISKLSACPWSRVLLGQATHRCEHLLLREFSNRKFILPEKLTVQGQNKRESKYKGGMVLDPIRGFYDTCIVVLDFNSLYPSIIREYNICFTTVDRVNPNANNSKSSKISGVLPTIMTNLLEARGAIKTEIKKLNHELDLLPPENSAKREKIRLNLERCAIKEKAIKVLANSIYGYLGYRGSRFQAKELAALITEQGRLILSDTVNTMRTLCGSESAVIYGDTDSVMVNSGVVDVGDAKRKAEELSIAISKKYKYLCLGIDYIFLKMLLVQKKKYAAYVYNEGRDATIQMKGLDMVRRDWSSLTKSMSNFIINQFLKENQDKDQAVNNIIEELSAISKALHNGGKLVEETMSKSHPKGINIGELVIFKALKKNIDQYAKTGKNPPHVAVALKLRDEKHMNVKQGDTIGYFICDSELKDISSKARDRESVTNFESIDVDWYLKNQLLHPLWRLCEPFGQMQFAQLSNALGCSVRAPIESLSSENDNNPVFQIPRVVELVYSCRGCNQQIRITPKFGECIKCAKCDFQNNLKDVANQLTEYVKKFLTDPKMKDESSSETKLFACNGYLCSYRTAQLPLATKKPHHNNEFKDGKGCGGKITPVISSVDVFNTLRYFKALFDLPKRSIDEFKEFREYMSKTMDYYYQMHGFTRVNFHQFFPSEKP